MYDLKIIKVNTQDLRSLEGILLKMPELDAKQISIGLKYPPLKVLTTNGEDQAQAMKNTLEKMGTECVIENADPPRRGANVKKSDNTPLKEVDKEEEKKFQWKFLLVVCGIIAFLILTTIYFSNINDSGPKQSVSQKVQPAPQATQQQPVAVGTASAAAGNSPAKKSSVQSAKEREALKKDLVKNSYDAEAWKALADNLEAEGDSAAAQAAKNSYEKAVRTQMVLASLAKTFGNNVRVEITETSVFYRTSKELTESQFYQEAERLRDSLNAKFPGKRNLVIENYTSNNQMQRVILEP